MAWAKNGTPNTLTGTADDCDITDLTAYKFNVFLAHVIASGSIRIFENLNNNTNSVYAYRTSENGGADSTGTSQTKSNNNSVAGAGDDFIVQYLCSITGEEKLSIIYVVDQQASGASTAPSRQETVRKFVPSPDADITRIDLNNNHTGDYAVGTNLSALGTD